MSDWRPLMREGAVTREERAAALLVCLLDVDELAELSRAHGGYRRALERAQRRPSPGFDAFTHAVEKFYALRRQSGLSAVGEADDGSCSQGYLLSASEAGSVAGTSVRTLQRLAAGGQVPVVKIGRRALYDPLALIEALAERGTNVTTPAA